MSEEYLKVSNLSVSKNLYDFINNEALPNSGISSNQFWRGLSRSLEILVPINKKLLDDRRKLQLEIDRWHLNNNKNTFDLDRYETFLKKIGYLKKEGPDFKIKTKNLDAEISNIPGPQLVVPISNSRYALNAVNARYQSLYDSLYGTDVIKTEESASERYDPERGLEVIKYSKKFLDKFFTLKKKSRKDVIEIKINNNIANKIIATGKEIGGRNNRYGMSSVLYDYYGNVVDKAIGSGEGQTFIGKYQQAIRNALDKGQSPDEIFSLTASARTRVPPGSNNL